jgi:hypothetical protein
MGYQITEADYKSITSRDQQIIDSTTATKLDKYAAQKEWLQTAIYYEQQVVLAKAVSTRANQYNAYVKYVNGYAAYTGTDASAASQGINPYLLTLPVQYNPYVSTVVAFDQVYAYNFPGGAQWKEGDTLYPSGPHAGQKVRDVACTDINAAVVTIKANLVADQTLVDDSNSRIKVWTQSLSDLVQSSTGTTPNPYSALAFDQIEKGILILSQSGLKYNASYPKEAYFSSQENFSYELNKTKYAAMSGQANSPKLVSDAMNLWSQAFDITTSTQVPSTVSHKGMIVPRADLFNKQKGSNKTLTPTAALVPTDSKGDTVGDVALDQQKYGFQFMYNPASLDMVYQGTPDVDVGYEVSGSEQFGLIGGIGVTQSTISFDLIINRMFDMKYLDPNYGLSLGLSVDDIYDKSSNQPNENDLVRIYHFGTMYDVEFLLRALLGYQATTYLRTFATFDGTSTQTADIGYLGAMPVELHLGQSLRYLGIINGMSIRHIIFNSRMVPTFTTMRLQLNRIPDFASQI